MKNKILEFCGALEVRSKYFVVLFFLAYFILGIFIFRDYGVSWDEGFSRERGLITYNYIFYHDQKLLNYENRSMGQLFDTFLVFIEKSFMSSNDARDIYLMRHFVVFMFFYVGVIFFYRLCFERFRSWKIALLGCLFLILSPRIFAHSFYNPKDIPFLSAMIISMYTMKHFLDKKNVPTAFWHALSVAVTTGIKMIGFFIIILTCFFFIAEMFVLKTSESIPSKEDQQGWKSLLVCIGTSFIFIFLFWPVMWTNPAYQFNKTIHQAENFTPLAFRVDEFGGSLDEIKPLLAELGQPTERFASIDDAVDWLNDSIVPFQIYVNHIKKSGVDESISKIIPPGFIAFTNNDFKKLANTGSGQTLKRIILNQLYPQDTPKDWNILYMGRHFPLSVQLPWHYVPVWIFISTPCAYSLCFILGFFAMVKAFLAKPVQFLTFRRDDLIYILLFFLPLLSIFISKAAWNASSFNEWRHLFFIYPAFLLIAMSGLIWGIDYIKSKFNGLMKISLCMLFFSFLAWNMLDTACFMIRNHPFEAIYVNKLAGKDMQEVKDRFDLDAWGVSYRKALEYVLQADSSPKVPVFISSYWLKQYILPAIDRERLVYVDQPSLARYILEESSRRNFDRSRHEFYSIKVDGAKIMVVYKWNDG